MRTNALRLATLGFVLIACELLLQVANTSSITARRVLAPAWEVIAATIPDDRLGSRGNPLRHDHDRAGYRNPMRPSRADIVVLGDSHAYGPARDADGWPRRLERDLARPVYNMALPGYGPGQSLLQIDEALAFRPRLIIVAPYMGNDFIDTYALARRHPELLANVDPSLRAAAIARDRHVPIEQEVDVFFLLGATSRPDSIGGPRQWLSQHVRFYGLARALRARFAHDPIPAILSREFATAEAGLTVTQRQYASVLNAGTWRTILTPAYRSLMLDDRDPRVRVGFDAATTALLQIHTRCRAAGVPVLVAIHPTKESVFWPRVLDPTAHPGLEKLVADEATLRGEMMTALDRQGVAHVDLLHALRSAPDQTYFEDIDGHPNAVGHAVIAKEVASHAARLLR